MTKREAADQAIKAYDAFIFSSFGRTFDGERADLLALNVVEACESAARDGSVSQFTRDYYAGLRDQFRLIAA